MLWPKTCLLPAVYIVNIWTCSLGQAQPAKVSQGAPFQNELAQTVLNYIELCTRLWLALSCENRSILKLCDWPLTWVWCHKEKTSCSLWQCCRPRPLCSLQCHWTHGHWGVEWKREVNSQKRCAIITFSSVFQLKKMGFKCGICLVSILLLINCWVDLL